MHHHLSQPLLFLSVMFAGLFHVLSMFLPSRLLTWPKISENIEISINSPNTIKLEPDTGTSSMSAVMGQGTDGSATGPETLSSPASSLSDRPDTAGAGTETPRSLTPGSSVESVDDTSHKSTRSLPQLWTEQSEKARCQTLASPSHHTDSHSRLSPGHLTTSCLCPARNSARRY